MIKQIESSFRKLAPAVEYCSLRLVKTTRELIKVVNSDLDDHEVVEDYGGIISVIHKGGSGYAATPRLDTEGIRNAIHQAVEWAKLSARYSILPSTGLVMPTPNGSFQAQESQPWDHFTLSDKTALLNDICSSMAVDERIISRHGGLDRFHQSSHLIFPDGNTCSQEKMWITPSLYALAHENGETQCRSWGGQLAIHVQQGGLEHLDKIKNDIGKRIGDEALQLLLAPECPSETLDLLVMPDQMALQIHESIGHPLEMDRVLGDERNMAGTSFVTADMVGSYRYGSDLLNVSFDPTLTSELGSYGWDDDGSKAQKHHLIEKGTLKRLLGGYLSQQRSGLPGVACSRAESWHRAPVDRMANINVEPGDSALDDMIASVENGLLVETNRSWSIDDSRNKFQFGCEWGRLIKNGELAGVVRNPGYRGISESFWRNLKAVGNKDTFQIMGTPYCGKAEPGQVITVGHASPACLFSQVEVFGGSHA